MKFPEFLSLRGFSLSSGLPVCASMSDEIGSSETGLFVPKARMDICRIPASGRKINNATIKAIISAGSDSARLAELQLNSHMTSKTPNSQDHTLVEIFVMSVGQEPTLENRYNGNHPFLHLIHKDQTIRHLARYNPRCETRTYPTFLFELLSQKIIELMPRSHCTTSCPLV